MIAAAVILLLIVVAVALLIGAGLREWLAEESRVESHLADPAVHTVAYAIPDGLDPAVLKIALGRAGFACAVTRVGDRECVRIECADSDRAAVRSVLESVHPTAFDGSELPSDHVVFEDER